MRPAPTVPTVGDRWLNTAATAVSGIPAGVVGTWNGATWDYPVGVPELYTAAVAAPLAPNVGDHWKNTALVTVSGVTSGDTAMWNAVASIHTRYYQIPPLILASVGIGTILLETFYPLLVLKNISRKITISLIILMHISIAIMLELYSFGAIMIVWNLVAFTNLTNIKPENENTS